MAVWEKTDAHTRVTAVHLDIMKHPQFALLSGTCMIGQVIIDAAFPTAATDGRDVHYGEAFTMEQSRKQLRYLVIHENLHKQWKHCTDYKDIVTKYKQLSGLAMDLSINQQIEEMDPHFQFVERPTIPPQIDKKYAGMGWMEILRELLKNQKPQDGSGGSGEPGDGPWDEHLDGTEEMTPEEIEDVGRQLDDAIKQGIILRDKLAGTHGSGGSLDEVAVKRDTNWREHLREFVQAQVKGDDLSRLIPPNKRMLAAGYLMPHHFTESMGELIIAADTSGSMGGVYPVLFGEVAQIVSTVRPDSVRVLWWDTAVANDQVFKPHEYDQIAGILKPAGGGGTTPSVVADYIKDNKIEAKAIVWLTDGYLAGETADPGIPALWGIIDNERYVSPVGKTLHINSLTL